MRYVFVKIEEGESNDENDNVGCLSTEADEVMREVNEVDKTGEEVKKTGEEVEKTGEEVEKEGDGVGVKVNNKEDGKVSTVG